MNDLSNTELALEYISGNKKAGEVLINKFNNLINTFAKLLYYGEITKSTTINNFINLLVGHNCKDKKEALYKNLKVINERYSSFDYEDVVQDLEVAFLSFIVGFDPNKIDVKFEYKFESYIINNFHFVVKRETVDSIVNTPIYYSGELDIDNFPGTNGTENIVFGINDSWVEGDTCSDVFSKLTAKERRLIKQRFIDDISVKDIAKMNGVTSSAISHKIDSIKNKLIR